MEGAQNGLEKLADRALRGKKVILHSPMPMKLGQIGELDGMSVKIVGVSDSAAFEKQNRKLGLSLQAEATRHFYKAKATKEYLRMVREAELDYAKQFMRHLDARLKGVWD